MVDLKQACDKVLSVHPGEYIHVVNEYEDAYQFILLNEGEEMTGATFVFNTPGVIKSTGILIDDACDMDDIFKGDYKQYTRSDIERL